MILCASGDHFTAGADLKDARRWDMASLSLAERRAIPLIGERMCQAWEDIPALTVTAIEGHCVGGGVALAVSTDFRVIGRSGYFRLPEVDLGIPLSWGALPRLVNILGAAKAKRFIMLCETFAGAEALDCGLADYLVPDGQACAKALELAQRVVDLPDVATKMSKEAINVTANALNRVASFMARDQLALAAQSTEATEARARFANKGRSRP